ncbi:ABC transporter permease [Vibrio hannami]|uniref:ABC transporter permease n=1 Tax=Vibrio hannami TaxID=2717094 RepID=UPI00240FBF18|nr:ABC transporter permease [Vibrio hannami]MDG3088167.1 ABC transporter permease [Vibrio hannami]
MNSRSLSQLHVLKNDWWLLACITVVPVLVAAMIWAIFSTNIARDLPFGVVTNDNTQLSRMLIRELDATSTLKVTDYFSSPDEAKVAMRNNAIYGFVVIPNEFSKDVYKGQQPQVSVFYNSQYILVGRLISGATSTVIGTFNAQVGTIRALSEGNSTTSSALGRSVTIQNQITPLFNKNTNYNQFLVGAAVPTIWQILIVVSTILALAANHRIYGLNTMLKSGVLRSVTNICSFYLPFFLIQGVLYVTIFYYGLNWPNNGSIVAILFAQLVTVVACMVMGSFFFFLTLDAARAMSFAGAFTAPSFAFLGVTFPVSDMGSAAQIWRSLLPASHYIEAQIAQSSYGVTSWQTIEGLVPMMWYLVPFLLVSLLGKKHLSKAQMAMEGK